MDFNLPEELQMLKDTVRKFVDKELIPIEMHTIENMELKPDVRERLEKKTNKTEDSRLLPASGTS